MMSAGRSTPSPNGTPSAAEKPLVKPGGLFSHPTSPEKRSFETKMSEAASRMTSSHEIIAGRPGQRAALITDAVHQILREKSLGFLIDNQQWRMLSEMLRHERFVLAALSGLLSPQFLANASKNELEHRAETLNGLPEDDFKADLRRSKVKDPDVSESPRQSVSRHG